MRVLVTGGAGFVGSHAAESLFRRGDQVVVLDDLSTGSLANLRHLEGRRGFTFIEGSAADRRRLHPLVHDADAVLHLAGAPTPLGGSEASARANLAMVRALFEEAALSYRRVVLVVPSTAAHVGHAQLVVRGGRAEEVLAGDIEWAPGRDEDVARYAHAELGVPATVVRLHNVVGPRQAPAFDAVLRRFVRQAVAGEPLVIHGQEDEGRSFAYVDDIVDGLLTSLDRSEAAGHAVTLGSDEEIAIADLARRVVRLLDSRSEIHSAPAVPGIAAAREPAPGVPDLEPARRWLGYAPRFTLDETVEALAADVRGDPLPGPSRAAPTLPLDGSEPHEAESPVDQIEQQEGAVRDEPVDRHVAEEAVSIIVPVYNEAPSIAEAIRRVKAQSIPMQLIVVDDGSTDDTASELRAISHLVDDLVVLPRNRGKGAALRAGLQLARHGIVVFHDADLELHADEIPALVRPVREGVADFVNGNRLHAKNRPFVPRIQVFGNVGLRWLARLLHGLPIRDMESAAKVLRRETLEVMALRSERFEIEPEIAAKAAALDVTFLELPISFRPRTRAEGKKLRWRDGVTALWTLLRYRSWSPGKGAPAPEPILVVAETGGHPRAADGPGAVAGLGDAGSGATGNGARRASADSAADAARGGRASQAEVQDPFAPPPFTPLLPVSADVVRRFPSTEAV